MDLGTIHGIYTIVFMTAFIVMAVWVFLPRRKDRYDDAANLPFDKPASGPDDKSATDRQE